MAKKEKLNIVAEDFVDVTRFGYDDDVLVEIPGQLLYALMRMIGQLANDEVKWQYQINPESLSETAHPDNVVNVISNEGITYFNFLGELESIHGANVRAGKTLPIEDIQEKVQKKIQDAINSESQKSNGDAEIVKLPAAGKKRVKKGS